MHACASEYRTTLLTPEDGQWRICVHVGVNITMVIPVSLGWNISSARLVYGVPCTVTALLSTVLCYRLSTENLNTSGDGPSM